MQYMSWQMIAKRLSCCNIKYQLLGKFKTRERERERKRERKREREKEREREGIFLKL